MKLNQRYGHMEQTDTISLSSYEIKNGSVAAYL